MIYSVDFLEMAEKLNPFSVSKYLDDTGWTFIPRSNNEIKVYQNTANGFFQITIPMSKKLSDYKHAMYHAINTVAKFEKRSLEQVFLYLLNPNADILKIRVENPVIEAGNIFLDDAISVYQNAKKLLGAAALDILHPRKFHQGRMDDSVANFLSNCKFGQTEVGSYVVSVICPFTYVDDNGYYNQMSIFSKAEQYANSLTRKVTNRIMKNICTIKDNIDSGNTDKLMSNKELISANFYEALMGMNLDMQGSSVHFWTEWAPTAKSERIMHNQAVVLTHDYYEPLAVVKNHLKEYGRKATRIVGKIKRMESLPDASKRTDGKVTVVYLNDNNRPRQVVVQLGKDDYQHAIEAHEKGWYVEIVGQLSKDRNATMKCDLFSVVN